MALVIPFARRSAAAGAAEHVRFRPEARAALIAITYVLPVVRVQFHTDGSEYEWAAVGPAAHFATWFTVHPVVNGDLMLRDDQTRLVGRYETGAALRAVLQPLVRALLFVDTEVAITPTRQAEFEDADT